MRGVRFMLAQGEDVGKTVDETKDEEAGRRLTSVVHRAAFLTELLADDQQERIHASKKLEKFARNDDQFTTLYFSDETTHECDILIGADGIHSTFRNSILWESDSAAFPRNTGSWVVMTLKPYAEAQDSIGKGGVDIESAQEYMWIGNGGYLMHNILSRGQLVQFIIASHEKDAESSGRWMRMEGAGEIKRLYKDYSSHLYKFVVELLCDQPEQLAMYLRDHSLARTYLSGLICITGDAAHATTPWQGSGGGMSIEDSLILSTLLGHSKTPAEAQIALKEYNQYRCPRTQRIVEPSRETGQIVMGLGEETRTDLGSLREGLLLISTLRSSGMRR